MIHHIRRGFATNSSSSHSILILKPGQERPADYLHYDGEFGWEFFTASSEETRRRYVAAFLRSELRDDPALLRRILIQRLGFEPEAIERQLDPDNYNGWYVNHQSVPTLLGAWEGEGVDEQFLEDLIHFYLRDDVVVLGGNDNTQEEHPLGGVHPPFPTDEARCHLVGRRDSRGYWTIFNQDTGTKIRFSFEGDLSVPEISGTDAPELVDLKITDFCTAGCTYCYQGSTPKGRHADLETVERILDELARLRVFEVAIGGGEPTEHPHFSHILEYARKRGIVPNFSTRNLGWFSRTKLPRDMWGACGFSVDGPEEARRVIEALGDEESLTFHYVVGSRPDGALGLVRSLRDSGAYHHVVLLAFKPVGRGVNHAVHADPLLPVLQEVREHQGVLLGFDTPLAAAQEALLKDVKVPSWCYETTEGRYSMYIDAVERRAGPSSYCDESLMGPLAQDIAGQFQAFNERR